MLPKSACRVSSFVQPPVRAPGSDVQKAAAFAKENAATGDGIIAVATNSAPCADQIHLMRGFSVIKFTETDCGPWYPARMKALLLASAILMHPLYSVTDGDPKTCYELFPDTKGRKCCDRAYKDRVRNRFVTEDEKPVLEQCAGKKAQN
jgi:hypothetical protein